MACYADCKNYSVEFQKELTRYKSFDDDLGQYIFKFLSDITSILMTPLEPYNVKAIEKMICQSLSGEKLSLLRDLIIPVDDPEKKARMADILWICKQDPVCSRPIKMANEAVVSYLKSARNLENLENWMSCYSRLKRAAELACIVDGKKNIETRH